MEITLLNFVWSWWILASVTNAHQTYYLVDDDDIFHCTDIYSTGIVYRARSMPICYVLVDYPRAANEAVGVCDNTLKVNARRYLFHQDYAVNYAFPRVDIPQSVLDEITETTKSREELVDLATERGVLVKLHGRSMTILEMNGSISEQEVDDLTRLFLCEFAAECGNFVTRNFPRPESGICAFAKTLRQGDKVDCECGEDHLRLSDRPEATCTHEGLFMPICLPNIIRIYELVLGLYFCLIMLVSGYAINIYLNHMNKFRPLQIDQGESARVSQAVEGQSITESQTRTDYIPIPEPQVSLQQSLRRVTIEEESGDLEVDVPQTNTTLNSEHNYPHGLPKSNMVKTEYNPPSTVSYQNQA